LSFRDEFLVDNGLVRLQLGFCVLEKLARFDVIGVDNLMLGVYKLLRADMDPSNGFP
jgi:hypothetical protein